MNADELTVLAQRILDALAEAEGNGDPRITWYGYVALDDVRRLAEAIASVAATR